MLSNFTVTERQKTYSCLFEHNSESKNFCNCTKFVKNWNLHCKLLSNIKFHCCQDVKSKVIYPNTIPNQKNSHDFNLVGGKIVANKENWSKMGSWSFLWSWIPDSLSMFLSWFIGSVPFAQVPRILRCYGMVLVVAQINVRLGTAPAAKKCIYSSPCNCCCTLVTKVTTEGQTSSFL